MIQRKKAIVIFVTITLFRLFLAYFFPITGDEGYFYRWGQYPDTVYYDHPGLVGWWMWIAHFFGQHIFFPRLLEVLLGLIIALGLYSIVKDITSDKNKAMASALLFYSTPMSLLSILITTDTPLVLFVFLSGWFYLRSFKHNEIVSYLLSAFFLGLAFWSKYLMFFMVWALLVCLFLTKKEFKKKLMSIFIYGVVGLVFVISHFYWSSQNCWWSVTFNFFNRESETQFKWSHILTYIGFLLYLTTPWLFYLMIRRFKELSTKLPPTFKAAWIMYFVPLLLLAIPSSTYANLHWPLSYVPFIFIAILGLSDFNFDQYFRYNLIFTFLHMIFLTVLIFLPDQVFSTNKFYNDIIIGKYGNEIDGALEKYKDDYNFGTNGYSTAGLMHYHNNRPYFVFNDKDNNGRSDDKWTDFRLFEGKNMLIISTYPYKPYQLEEFKKYFTDVIYEDLTIRGATFFIARGHNFNFRNYLNYYLSWVKDKYYKTPSYLPVGQCFFFEKYFNPSALDWDQSLNNKNKDF